MGVSDAFLEALGLLVSLDPGVLSVIRVSLSVSLVATALAAVVGFPIGFLVGSHRFAGSGMVEVLLRTATAIPTVVVGLIVYALLSRRGFFGPLGLLYTRTAIVIGEMMLATPLVAALTVGIVRNADARIRDTALTLGAPAWRAALELMRETRPALVAALATAFGRVISELGIAVMVGGNIEGQTRTMATAIALETSKGEFALGFALGLVLLSVALGVNVVVGRIASEARP